MITGLEINRLTTDGTNRSQYFYRDAKHKGSKGVWKKMPLKEK